MWPLRISPSRTGSEAQYVINGSAENPLYAVLLDLEEENQVYVTFTRISFKLTGKSVLVKDFSGVFNLLGKF